ncbi:methyltransferase domain-containing protein [Phreatobacter sp.]|uniref:class I SAM-dependent DNA methyltransferase n=1 Tax=Phreatobacter sp. TaxID=1966341 RepID=UPI003F6E4766
MTAPLASSGDLIADRRYAWGVAARDEGDLAAAADLFAQAAEAAPRWPAAWLALGEAKARLGECEAAVAAFRTALRADPADRLGAGLHLARLGAGEAAAAMTPAYVAALFDDFAPRFETALVDRLGYCGPDLLADALQEACARTDRPFAFDRMLDLGCGTGLSAVPLAGVARVIDGVDLAPRMVAAARRKGLYRDLAVADLADWLAAQPPASADLVVAADVVVYCADLAGTLAAMARVLAAGGLVAFTCETHDGEGTVLLPGLRYAHGEALVRSAIAGAGLGLLTLQPASIRREAGQPTAGYVVVAGSASAAR